MTTMHVKSAIISVACAFLATAGAWAQSTEAITRQLAQTGPAGSAKVTITMQGDAQSALRSLESIRTGGKIRGYRVRIFFDNSQDAREKASVTRARFMEAFPGIPVYMNYENPYFKVSVGNCVTNEEAIILWGRTKGMFDKAFVIREDIPMAEFAKGSFVDAPPADAQSEAENPTPAVQN